MEKQLHTLLSDYAHTFYGQDAVEMFTHPDPNHLDSIADKATRDSLIKQRDIFRKDMDMMSKFLGDYVKRMYTDPQTGMTRWLGRAMGLLTQRYSVTHQDPALMAELSGAAKRQGMDLNNIVGNRLRMAGQNGMNEIVVETGDTVYVKTKGMESAAIALAAGPENPEALAKAKKMGLIGGISNVLLQVLGHDATRDGISRLNRWANYLSQRAALEKGFSHIGQAIVYDVEVTPEVDAHGKTIPMEQRKPVKIRHLLIGDNYPYPHDITPGGVRFGGVEHFARKDEESKFGVSNIDEEKFIQHMDRELAKPFQEDAFISQRPTYGPDGEVLPELDRPSAPWKDKAREAREILKSIKDPHQRYLKWQELVRHGWREMLTDGVYFNWVNNGSGYVVTPEGKKVWVPGAYLEGGTYCTQAVELASRVYTGVSLEADGYKGAWSKLLRPLQWFKVKPAMELRLTDPILPPVNMAVQPYSGKFTTVQYENAGIHADAAEKDAPPNTERNSTVTRMLKGDASNTGMNIYEVEKLTEAEKTILHDRGIDRLVESRVAEGSKGEKHILGYDPESIEKLRELKKAKVNEAKSKLRKAARKVKGSKGKGGKEINCPELVQAVTTVINGGE